MKIFRRFGAELVRSAVIALVISGTFATAQVWKWSQTAGTNASSDPHINWAEGMAPSAVNDSSRAEMAELAKWRDDISGKLTTGGTSTAYTVTTNQGLNTPTPTDGQMIAITMHATNDAAPTLAADGGTAYAIQTSPGVAVSAATLVLGTTYTLKFSNANSAWILRDFYGSPFIVPIGAMIPYTGTTAPNANFLFPVGQCISRTTYASYFAIVGTTFGACDGSTTFGVPDMRGRNLVGLDNLGGASNANRISTACASTTNGATCGGQSQNIAQANLPNVIFPVINFNDPGHTHTAAVSGGFVGGTASLGLGAGGAAAPVNAANIIVTNSVATTGITFQVSSGGSGTALTTVQPSLLSNFILRIL